ncbi:hypothetical protein MTO96_049968 [Rhipicephalus appendiculatus]
MRYLFFVLALFMAAIYFCTARRYWRIPCETRPCPPGYECLYIRCFRYPCPESYCVRKRPDWNFVNQWRKF